MTGSFKSNKSFSYVYCRCYVACYLLLFWHWIIRRRKNWNSRMKKMRILDCVARANKTMRTNKNEIDWKSSYSTEKNCCDFIRIHGLVCHEIFSFCLMVVWMHPLINTPLYLILNWFVNFCSRMIAIMIVVMLIVVEVVVTSIVAVIVIEYWTAKLNEIPILIMFNLKSNYLEYCKKIFQRPKLCSPCSIYPLWYIHLICVENANVRYVT